LNSGRVIDCSVLLVPLRYATALLAVKTAKKLLKCAVEQLSGLFFVAHMLSASAVVAEFCCATLNISRITLRYAALTATVSVAAHCWLYKL
jgi:hypothetical protein